MTQMGVRDYWDRMLVYFGIAEDPEEFDHATSGQSASARRGRSRSVEHDDDDWDDDAAPARSRGSQRRSATGRSTSARPAATRPRGMTTTSAGVGIVPPRTFNDAQAIADHLKRGVPVIVNLQQTDSDLAKRLIDFASGLTYGLDGAMQRIADKVFLLTPPNVDVSAEERAAILEGGFFNQS